jgi:hypothetical protein
MDPRMRRLVIEAASQIERLEQFKEWAEPQIVQHGADTLLIAQLRAALKARIDACGCFDIPDVYGYCAKCLPAADLLGAPETFDPLASKDHDLARGEFETEVKPPCGE